MSVFSSLVYEKWDAVGPNMQTALNSHTVEMKGSSAVDHGLSMIMQVFLEDI